LSNDAFTPRVRSAQHTRSASAEPRELDGREQLGHASVQTTLNIYTHVVDGSHRQAIEQLERRLFPTVPKSLEGTAGPVAQVLE